MYHDTLLIHLCGDATSILNANVFLYNVKNSNVSMRCYPECIDLGSLTLVDHAPLAPLVLILRLGPLLLLLCRGRVPSCSSKRYTWAIMFW